MYSHFFLAEFGGYPWAMSRPEVSEYENAHDVIPAYNHYQDTKIIIMIAALNNSIHNEGTDKQCRTEKRMK
jgi:hypothetical protein